MAVPHHTTNEMHHFPPDLFEDGGGAVELFQDHRGSCETKNGPGSTAYPEADEPGSYLQEQLQRGKKLAFLGGGDHTGTALTGAWVESCSRRGIFEALQERRVFATTSAPASVDCRVDGTFVGGRLSTAAETVQVTLAATAPDGVDEVHLLQHTDVVEREAVGGEEVSLEWERPIERPETPFYCRLLLSNGEVAWSSPIWVEQV
jgi:hypothetical protein